MSKCASCKKDVPEGAKFCPACGHRVEEAHPMHVEVARSEKKSLGGAFGTGVSWPVFLGVAAVLLVVFMVQMTVEPSNTSTSTASKQAAKYQPPTREQQVSRGFSSWNGSHRALVDQVKASLKDPRSFEHVETRYTDHGDNILTVTMRYRAKNSFGAVVPGFVSARVHIEGHVVEITSSR